MLDEIEAAHAVVGGARRARAFARQQINQAYVVVLASHFQLFCRDLHSNGVDALLQIPAYAPLEAVLSASLTRGRRLSMGNATPTNIGEDFLRFGFDIWKELGQTNHRTPELRETLESLNRWRNAVAHQDFGHAKFAGRDTLRIAEVRAWRRACDRLAVDFDRVLGLHLKRICGVRPW
ncbi:MAG: hypothetical protein JO306_05760 [Gemmatimonadetes bacterium]|nr:hypothetical protein [Gemmatimonadota bacterium]